MHIALKIVVGIAIVGMLLSLLMIWRLSAGPLASSFLTPYIAAYIDRYLPDTHTEIAHSLLTWDNMDHSVSLHIDGLQIKDKDGASIAELPNMDIRLSTVGFLPTELTVDNPHAKLERKADGKFYFGTMTTSEPDASDSDMKVVMAHVTKDLSHAFITHKLQISGAVFDVHDDATQSDWSVHIPEISLERINGTLEGHATLDVTQKDQVSKVDIHYSYNRHKNRHMLDTQFSAITPSFFAGGHPATLGLSPAAILNLPLSGTISAALNDDLDVELGSVNVHGDAGELKDPDLWNKPRAVKTLDIRADYAHEGEKLNITSAVIDFGGPKLSMTVTGANEIMPKHDVDFIMNVQLDNWPMDQYAELWPKPIITDARDWILQHMSKGNFDHGEAVFKGAFSWSDLGNMVMTEGKGKVSVSHGTVQYMDGMPPVENVSANATFDLNQMQVQIAGGTSANLRLQPFTIAITDFESDVQNIDIPLKFTGSIPDVLRLIDAPPLGYTKSLGLTPDDITGDISGQVGLRFPLLNDLKMKDMAIKASANLANVASSKLVKGIDLSQGNLGMALDKDGFNVKGPVAINKVPLQINWQQNFDENSGKPLVQADINGPVSGDQWKSLGVDALASSKGAIAVQVHVTQPTKELTSVSGSLDMNAAEMDVDQLNWKKPAGTAALLKFAADMPFGKNIEVKSIDFHGAQISAVGDATLTADGTHILSVNLKPLIVGRTNANLSFSQTEDDRGPQVFTAEGDALDISGFKSGNNSISTAPRPKEYLVKVGKLFTSENGFISHISGSAIRDEQGWNNISLHGQADGNHQLDIALTPKPDGRRVFAVACDDFGKALKGMGITDTVAGGSFNIYGSSTAENPHFIEGKIKIGHFTVGKLPVLALLLNATSPFGFAGLLNGDMDFDHMDGQFHWNKDEVELIDVRAAGAAVGMNIDGKVDLNSVEANLHGTIVPFSMVNRFLNYIPVIGTMITGGDGQGVLAVAYKITGSLDTPKISVNPVSLLTPGFLRTLFFSGGNDDDEEDQDKASDIQALPPTNDINKTQ